ncbi:MAG: glycoside hydrolase family 172 protein [Kiritimatiellia bacterium]
MKRIFALLTMILLAAGCSRVEQEVIPYDTLLDWLANEQGMARFDQPGARVATSYDRTGNNDDFNNFLREGPPGWKVLVDLEGPGYISRFWFTGSKDGTKRLRFYFDGEKEPSIDTTMDAFMGKTEPLTLPLAGYEPYCWFSWLPVPYRERLVIMEQDPVPGEKLYFHLAYNQLPPGYTVESFSLPLSDAAQAKVERIKAKWNERGLATEWSREAEVTLVAGERATVMTLEGAGSVQEVQFTPDWSGFTSPTAMEQALRSLVVRMYWDGNSSPSVEAPLGALCGSMWKRLRYQSLHFGLSGETLMLKFPMPFRNGARIEIENMGEAPVPMKVAAVTGDAMPAAGYFHSGWKKSTPNDVGRPHTIVQTAGRGKYVGCILGVQTFDQSWWVLEGDELMWIDGESAPSWKGTGLEDYFNGGWYYANAIASPLQGMPYKVHFRNIQYRLHRADPVRFDTSLAMVFERGPDHKSRAFFESVSFYYLDAPAAADSDVGRQSLHPQPDPLTEQTLMFDVNDRERMGDWQGAADAVTMYLEQFPASPFREILQQRLVNYAQGEVIPEGQALLGVYANMPVTVFINGKPEGRFGNPQGMQFKLVELGAGEHVIALQAPRQQYPDWVQVGLKIGDRIVGTDASWKYSFDQQAGWSDADFDDASWPEHGWVWVKGPPEEPFVVTAPNPHPGMQSVPWGIRPPVDWPAGARQVFYRKRFSVD